MPYLLCAGIVKSTLRYYLGSYRTREKEQPNIIVQPLARAALPKKPRPVRRGIAAGHITRNSISIVTDSPRTEESFFFFFLTVDRFPLKSSMFLSFLEENSEAI